MAPWHQGTSSSPHQAVVYMLHSAVLKGNLWNLRRLSASVPRTHLFVLYDGKALPERVHGLIEAHAQVVACPWRDSLATMSPHILNLSQEEPELRLNGHSFIEPVLTCWCERFCSFFSRAWFIEKDAGFNGAVHQFFSSFDADDSDLLTHRFNLVQPEGAWLGHISNVKGQVGRAELQRHGAAFLSDLADPEPGFENHSGVLWSQIIVRAWSERVQGLTCACHPRSPAVSQPRCLRRALTGGCMQPFRRSSEPPWEAAPIVPAVIASLPHERAPFRCGASPRTS